MRCRLTRKIVLIVCSGICLFGVLVTTGLAAEPAAQFLQSLRDAGYHDMAIEYLERMRTSRLAPIVSSEVTEAFENIYHKRHIAAGIPSMYGTYREPKFDAMGLMLRLMAFLKPRLEACVAELDRQPVSWASIRDGHRVMVEMIAGLRIPIYTVGFEADLEELGRVSSLVEAASIDASEEDVEFKIAALFNAGG